MAKYTVHMYRVVRLPYEVEAPNQYDAIAQANRLYQPRDLMRYADDAEEVTGYLVDELDVEGKVIYENSHSYDAFAMRDD